MYGKAPIQPSIEEALWAVGGGGYHVVLAGARIIQPRDVTVGPANFDGLYGGGFTQPKVQGGRVLRGKGIAREQPLPPGLLVRVHGGHRT